MALQFLGWMENLDDEEGEVPPRWIWFDDKALEEHFDAVKKRRKERFGDKKDGPKEIDDPVQNEAARDLIAGRG